MSNIFENKGALATTILVAASDSLNPGAANYVCDGVADDVEIQAAIDALPATYGGKVLLSIGTFNITTSILITKPMVFIEGSGQGDWANNTRGAGTRIVLANGSNCDMIKNTDNTPRTLFVWNLTLEGNSAGQASGNGINIDYLQLGGHYKKGLFCVNIYDMKQNGIFSSCAAVDCGIYASSFYIGSCLGSGIYFTNGCQGASIRFPNWIVSNGSYGGYFNGGTDCTLEIYAELNTGVQVDFHNAQSKITAWAASGGVEGARFIGVNDSIVDVLAIYNNQLDGDVGAVVIQSCTNSVFSLMIKPDLAKLNSTGVQLAQNCDSTTIRGSISASGGRRCIQSTSTFAGRVSFIGCTLISPNSQYLQIWLDGGWKFNVPYPSWIIRDCTGFIMPGEGRFASGSLTAGNANAICFAWHNPEAQDILIKKVVIEVTTAGGTAGSHLDVGIADDAAGTNRGTEFFDDLLLNNIQVNDSFLNTDGGQQTKWVFCQDSASATDGWIVGQILDANAASLVGKYYIEYVGR